MNILGSTQIACKLFQKMFVSGLKKDTWVSEIKQNNKEGLVFDVKKPFTHLNSQFHIYYNFFLLLLPLTLNIKLLSSHS